MRLPKAPRTVLDVSLRLARAPVDAAIDLIPERRGCPRAAARRAVDTVDTGARSLLGLTSEDRETRESPAPQPPAPQPPAPQPPAPAVRAPEPPRAPTHEEIAARAFELYERGVPGDAESHWQAAERELSARES